jgi:hypothetical protein
MQFEIPRISKAKVQNSKVSRGDVNKFCHVVLNGSSYINIGLINK